MRGEENEQPSASIKEGGRDRPLNTLMRQIRASDGLRLETVVASISHGNNHFNTYLSMLEMPTPPIEHLTIGKM